MVPRPSEVFRARMSRFIVLRSDLGVLRCASTLTSSRYGAIVFRKCSGRAGPLDADFPRCVENADVHAPGVQVDVHRGRGRLARRRPAAHCRGRQCEKTVLRF
jgi:hypothetical protein